MKDSFKRDLRNESRRSHRPLEMQEEVGETRDKGDKTREEGGETRDRGDKTREEGGETRDRGDKTSEEGGETRDRGDKTREEGGETRDRGGKTREEGGETRDRGGKTREEGGETRDRGGKTREGRTETINSCEVAASRIDQAPTSVAKECQTPKSPTLLYFSNKGFEDDLSERRTQVKAVHTLANGARLAKSAERGERWPIMSKLRQRCLSIQLRCLGIALVCLIFLALFVIPPSTMW